MATVEQGTLPLTEGLKLSREEFLRRWELHPEITKAELIGGTVHMPSPVSAEHGDREGHVGLWLGTYWFATPGTAFGHNSTSLLLEDAPQPDINLRILPECGGASWIDDKLLHGSPEMLTEVCLTSGVYDLHVKYDLYESARVQEYVVVLVERQELRWHHLVDGRYQIMQPDADGILRSRVFPGLWLDSVALLACNMTRVFAVLQLGLASPEHQVFVERLAEKRSGR